MSGKKFELKKLLQLKRKQDAVVKEYDPVSCDFPVDWQELSKLFFSKRNVIVEYPGNNPYGALKLAAFYVVLKMVREGASIGMCNYGQYNGFPYFHQFAKSISSKPTNDNLLTFHYEVIPKNPKKHDEWIMNADTSPTIHARLNAHENEASLILEEIRRTQGFQTYNDQLFDNSRSIIGWEATKKPRDKKVLVTWDIRDRTSIKWVMENYPDQFVLISYTKEKRMVDNWFRNNETMVDPSFDIQLLEPGIDVRKTLMYASTNHLNDFRNFARVLPEVVKEHITKDELKDLL